MAISETGATVAGTIDLGPDMPGYELELRYPVLEPGAAKACTVTPSAPVSAMSSRAS